MLTWQVSIIDRRDVQLLEKPSVIARFLAFQYTGYNLTQIILYWQETLPLKIDSNVKQKFVQTSLMAYTKNPEDYTKVKDALLLFGQSTVNYWGIIEAWSWIAISIAQSRYVLMTVTTSILILILIIHVTKTRKEKRRNLKNI